MLEETKTELEFTEVTKSKRVLLTIAMLGTAFMQSKGVQLGWITPEMQMHVAESALYLFGIAAGYVGAATTKPLGFFKR